MCLLSCKIVIMAPTTWCGIFPDKIISETSTCTMDMCDFCDIRACTCMPGRLHVVRGVAWCYMYVSSLSS